MHAHRSFSSDNLMISFVAHALLAADEPTRQAVSRALLAQELVDAEHLGMLVSILHLSRMGHSAEYAKMCVATLREQREKEKLSDATRKVCAACGTLDDCRHSCVYHVRAPSFHPTADDLCNRRACVLRRRHCKLLTPLTACAPSPVARHLSGPTPSTTPVWRKRGRLALPFTRPFSQWQSASWS